MGEIRKRGDVYWVRFYRDGRRIEESSGSSKWKDASDLLKDREGAIAKGVRISARSLRFSFDDAVRDVVIDYQVNERRSVVNLDVRVRLHLLPYFGGKRLSAIRVGDVRAFIVHRLDAGASHAEINRELAIVKRAFRLAAENEKFHGAIPKIRLLMERNVRTGFFDDTMISAVLGHLPPAIQPVVRFAYLTGWRVQSEVLPLEWRHVDRQQGEVRLEAGTTKNGEARVFPFTPHLRTLFDALWQEHDALKRRGVICPYVFQRRGARIQSFRGAWESACTAAGYPGMIVHDLRRSAVRNMERAGLSRSIAMRLTGHKTEAVYRRYAITSEADLREAVDRLAMGTVTGTDQQLTGTGRKPAQVVQLSQVE